MNASEGEKVAQINRAEGEAQALRLVAQASADAIRTVAAAIQEPGGDEDREAESGGAICGSVCQARQRKQHRHHARQRGGFGRLDFRRVEHCERAADSKIGAENAKGWIVPPFFAGKTQRFAHLI